MHRRKIDYYLYILWFVVLLLMFFGLGLTWAFYQRGDEEVFPILLNVTYIVSVILILTLCINISIIPMVEIILSSIDKKRNPEKYKAIEELDREIEKMAKELDEEIEKIMKEKNDGQ